jgi:hypothetical protein
MSRPRTKPSSGPIARALARSIAAVLGSIALGMTLGGCSEVYFDRRDTIAPGAGDAVAANEVAQTVDPWPAQSGNTNIASNGQRMQSAVEHYRTNTGVPPVDPMLMEVANTSPPTAQNSSQTAATPAQAPPAIAPGTTTTTTTVVTAAPSPSQ